MEDVNWHLRREVGAATMSYLVDGGSCPQETLSLVSEKCFRNTQGSQDWVLRRQKRFPAGRGHRLVARPTCHEEMFAWRGIGRKGKAQNLSWKRCHSSWIL